MTADKKFDSVNMKDKIQAQLLQDYQEMTDQDIRTAMGKALESSHSPVAQLWRKIQERPGNKEAA